jgi:hypothetical protein
MKKSILSEQFIRMQELAGIKPLYEYPAESYYGWRSNDLKDWEFWENTVHYSKDGEYVSSKNPMSLQAYKGSDKPFTNYGDTMPQNVKSVEYNTGDYGREDTIQWAKGMNEYAQGKYAKFEEGGEFFSMDPKKFDIETDEEGNIIKYVFSTRAIKYNASM